MEKQDTEKVEMALPVADEAAPQHQSASERFIRQIASELSCLIFWPLWCVQGCCPDLTREKLWEYSTFIFCGPCLCTLLCVQGCIEAFDTDVFAALAFFILFIGVLYVFGLTLEVTAVAAAGSLLRDKYELPVENSISLPVTVDIALIGTSIFIALSILSLCCLFALIGPEETEGSDAQIMVKIIAYGLYPLFGYPILAAAYSSFFSELDFGTVYITFLLAILFEWIGLMLFGDWWDSRRRNVDYEFSLRDIPKFLLSVAAGPLVYRIVVNIGRLEEVEGMQQASAVLAVFKCHALIAFFPVLFPGAFPIESVNATNTTNV